MNLTALGPGMSWGLCLVAVAAGCGGRPGGSAPRPASGPLPPMIAREAHPDPVPTIDPACDQDFTVAEARPVSATTVGHSYIANGGLVYLVLLRGSPAWYGNLEDWQIPSIPAGRHARADTIAGFPYDVTLDIRTKSLSVLDQKIDLQKTNVVFLDRVGNGVVVRGGELMNLCWASLPDPVGQVLTRSRTAAQFVTGSAPAPPRPAPVRRPRR